MELLSKKPLRVTDWEREVRVGLTASSLDQFEERVRSKMKINSEHTLRVVFESDGTEIDDEDYFITIEPHTVLMVLVQEQRWTPYKSNFILGLAVESDGEVNGDGVEDLIWRLHQDLSFFPWLSPEELGKIAKMDKEEMRNVVPDPNFVEFLQTLCERYLQEKDKGSEAPNGSMSNGIGGNRYSTASVLNDPLKLIRLYSRFNSMKAQKGYFSFSSCGSEESLCSTLSGSAGALTNNGVVANGCKKVVGAEGGRALPPLPPPRPTTPRAQHQHN